LCCVEEKVWISSPLDKGREPDVNKIAIPRIAFLFRCP
jgi:hypothetical protein